MFKPRPRRKLKTFVKGHINKVKGLLSPIAIEERISNSNWTPFLPTYEPQKWGLYDSDSCWVVGGFVTPVETQINWMLKNNVLPTEAVNFFNQYLDSTGSVAISEMFPEILCGNKLDGGTAEEAIQFAQNNGIIPRSMLKYSIEEAQRWNTVDQFENDYFNKQRITPQMIALGKQSLNYINIDYRRIGTLWYTPDPLSYSEALKQSPLSLGVAIPNFTASWNNSFVQFDGSKNMKHEVCGYAVENSQYDIFDQYNPFKKKLSSNYYIASCIQIVITAKNQVTASPVPLPQPGYWQKFFSNVWADFNNQPSPYPDVQIG